MCKKISKIFFKNISYLSIFCRFNKVAMIKFYPTHLGSSFFFSRKEPDDIVILVAKAAHRALEYLFYLIEIGVKYLITDPRKKSWRVRYKWSFRILMIVFSTIGIYYGARYIKLRIFNYFYSFIPSFSFLEKINYKGYVINFDNIRHANIQENSSLKSVMDIFNSYVKEVIFKSSDKNQFNMTEGVKKLLTKNVEKIKQDYLGSFQTVISVFSMFAFLDTLYKEDKNNFKVKNSKKKIDILTDVKNKKNPACTIKAGVDDKKEIT